MRSRIVWYISIWLTFMTISFVVEGAPNSNCVDKSTCPFMDKNRNEIFDKEISDFCRYANLLLSTQLLIQLITCFDNKGRYFNVSLIIYIIAHPIWQG